MLEPYHKCPSFETCSSNVCPLDPDYPSVDKVWVSGEDRCKAHKPTRERIGKDFPELKYRGLFMREFQGKARWAALTPAQRELVVQRGLKGLKSRKTGVLNDA